MSLRCAFCHGPGSTAETRQCPSCFTLLHVECWNEAGECPTLGCGKALTVDTSKKASARSMWREVALLVLIGAGVGAGVGVYQGRSAAKAPFPPAQAADAVEADAVPETDAEPVASPAGSLEELPGLRKLAEKRIFADEYEPALDACDRGLAIADDPYLFVARGYVKRELYGHRGAIEDFTRAIEMNGDYLAMAYSYRAKSRLWLQEEAGAIEDFNKALTVGGGKDYRDTTYLHRAYARRALGDFEGAVSDFNRFIDQLETRYSDPVWRSQSIGSAYLGRGITLLLLGRREKAVESFDAAKRSGGDDRHGELWLAALGEEAPLETKQWPGSLAWALRGIDVEACLAQTMHPNGVREKRERLCMALALLGVRAERTGNVESARTYYERCLETSDDSAYYEWARFRLARGLKPSIAAD